MKVKFYSTMPSDNENVLKGISGKIPALVVNLDTSPDFPVDETFIQMTIEEYLAYDASLTEEKEALRTIQEVQQSPQE